MLKAGRKEVTVPGSGTWLMPAIIQWPVSSVKIQNGGHSRLSSGFHALNFQIVLNSSTFLRAVRFTDWFKSLSLPQKWYYSYVRLCKLIVPAKEFVDRFMWRDHEWNLFSNSFTWGYSIFEILPAKFKLNALVRERFHYSGLFLFYHSESIQSRQFKRKILYFDIC